MRHLLFERQYLTNVRKLLDTETQQSRNSFTRRTFGLRYDVDLVREFPVLTTKFINFDTVVKETLWFLRGETNTRTLGARIWDKWADNDGECGPIYGKQWRDWGGKGFDQLMDVVKQIKSDPSSRRLVVSAWNVEDIPKMCLPPCHILFQFFVDGIFLSCQVYQRSADMMIGVPFNIASYALITHLVADLCGLIPHRLIWNGGDCHIYESHTNNARIQIERSPYPSPYLLIKRSGGEVDVHTKQENIQLMNYNHHPALSYELFA